MHFYQQDTEDILIQLHSTNNGLSHDDIQQRRTLNGWNELKESSQKSILQVFLSQFKDFLIGILLIAATISAFLGEIESTLVIAFVVFLNALLGTVQHSKAEHSLASLKAMSVPTAKVFRDGQIVQIPSREITVGDILLLDAGDFISADGRIIECHSLQVNESSLTGESLPVNKTTKALPESDLSLGDRTNMVFSGSFVTNGRATVVVTSIGMQTELGKIAHLLREAKNKKTPLQVSLDDFGKKLALAICVICIIIFSLDLLRGRELVDSFMFAVSLAVAAIPEALSSIVTIVLAYGTQKMAKENAIIRNLHAVESLGSVSVICTDKTGTLTQNKMAVQQIYIDNTVLLATQLQVENTIHERLLQASLLCNDAVTMDDKNIGDPTEIALVNLGETYALDELHLRTTFPRLAEVPFDSTRKCMSTLHPMHNEQLMFIKGGVDVLLSRMTTIETSQGIVKVTKQHIATINHANEKFSSQGLRVLAFGYKTLQKDMITMEDEMDFIFLGLVAMMDPPRHETVNAVQACKEAGIKTVMITGDHKVTAAAIAKEIGILSHDTEALEGKDIEKLSDKELQQLVPNISVYARVSPEHKIRIVKAWQQNGHVVAMTGDGVNDGPALKQAHIGVAMGITGTEVAKDASSMILTDDNFATIVKSISNGRSIYHNIQNAIQFLLSGNTGAIFVVLFATLLALPVPFAPVHLLFINLLTDSLPAIAIGLEKHNKNVMREKPRNIHVPILNKIFAQHVLLEGLLIGLVTCMAFIIGLKQGDSLLASTMAFATLCCTRLLHGFNCRSKQSIFNIGLFTNKQSWLAFVIGIFLLHAVLLIPALHPMFKVATLNGLQLTIIYGLSIIPLICIQGWKLWKN